MGKMARAAVQVGDRDIQIQEFRVPESVGRNEALLRVEACGMCGSDYEQYAGELAQAGFGSYPMIPGHEPIGWIEQIGDDASRTWGVKVGDRVAVEPFVPCAVCRFCTAGDYHLCIDKFRYAFTQTDVGPGLWGGYSEYMTLRSNTIVHRLPTDLSPEDGVLFNPVGSGFQWAYEAAGTRIGDSMLIFGPGQRGLSCVVAAKEAGAETIIVAGLRKDQRKLEIARQFGATHTLYVEEGEVVERVGEIVGGNGVDRVVDVTPYAMQPIIDGIDAARPGGTVVLAGVKGSMREAPGFVPDKVLLKDLRIRGALAVRSWAYRQAIRVVTSGDYPFHLMHTHTLTIDEVPRAMQILSGDIPEEKAIHMTIVPSD